MKNPGLAKEWIDRRRADALAVLRQVQDEFSPAAFATSFGAEDMVMLDMIASDARGIAVFTLDTGRLPAETYRLMERVRDRYPVAVEVYCPDTTELERFVNLNGPDAFYRSVAQRKQCCHVRKVQPLARALEGKKAWVTGLRREQSPTREGLAVREHDATHGIEKFNPLLDWSWEEVQTYIATRDVPYNELHDRGYPSIGCAPCTRAVEAGEDIRAGRWWWEDANSKECGLHVPGASPARTE